MFLQFDMVWLPSYDVVFIYLKQKKNELLALGLFLFCAAFALAF